MKNDGKHLEKIVQLIEKSIDSSAKIEHDVQMPILTSQIGATTQCDIVITSGIAPRETVTIIEVQDRTSKPAVNDFRGWQQKLDDVGAQHLICVSKEGFTKSEKEKASQSGNKIRLIKLAVLDDTEIPINFLKFHFNFIDFDIQSLSNMQISASKSEMEQLGVRSQALHQKKINLNENKLSRNKSELISVFIICRDLFSPPAGQESGKDKLTFLIDKNPLYFKVENEFLKIGLEFEFEWTNKNIDIPISTLSYEQDEYGTLAWMIEASYESSKGTLGFKMPIRQLGENYIINNMSIELPDNVEFSMYKNKNTIQQRIYFV